MEIKPIPTEYKGIIFRSRLEARWAVFLDQANADWEYEPEGFDLGDGVKYLPDFVVHGGFISNRNKRSGITFEEDLYIEVKGRMTEEDDEKINKFIGYKYFPETSSCALEGKRLLVVGNIPLECDEFGICSTSFRDEIEKHGRYSDEVFSYSTIDGDQWGCAPAVDKDGNFMIYGWESWAEELDGAATQAAYNYARNYRFDHGIGGNYVERKADSFKKYISQLLRDFTSKDWLTEDSSMDMQTKLELVKIYSLLDISEKLETIDNAIINKDFYS